MCTSAEAARMIRWRLRRREDVALRNGPDCPDASSQHAGPRVFATIGNFAPLYAALTIDDAPVLNDDL